MDDLDNFILGLDRKEPKLSEAALFMVGLKKLAEEGMEAPETPEMEAAEAMGMEEDPLALPAVDPGVLLASAASQAARCQLAANYYSETAQGPEGRSLAEELRSMAWSFCDDYKHLVRKLAVLTNGQPPPMPPVPNPEPAKDAKAAAQAMASCQQQYMLALQTLAGTMADETMHHTLQHMLLEQERCADKLALLTPAKTKTSALETAVKIAVDKLAAKEPVIPANAVPVPPPGAEPIEATALREMQLQLQQSEAEKQFLQQQASQAQQMAMEQAAATENAQAEADLATQNAEAAGMQAQEASMAAQTSMETATMAEENAAAQAEGKMRLSMRINQLRQQLADIVSQDPVMEEGMGFGAEPGPGAPATSTQQDQAAMDEAAMAEEAAAQPAPPSKAKKEVNQAQNAQAEADEQAAEAQAALGG